MNVAVTSGSPTELSGSQRFGPVLAQLQADAIELFGMAEPRLVPLAHEDRPFSHLLRVGVYRKDADHPDLHIFLKIFKPKPHDGGVDKMRHRVVHDFEITRRIASALAPSSELTSVRPIACYADHLALVTEQVDGDTLMVSLDKNARWFCSEAARRRAEDTLSSIGRWLRAFQAIDPGSGVVSLADLQSYIDIRLQRLVAHRVYAEDLRRRVLEHLARLGGQVNAGELADVLVHSDFAPGNIIVSGRKITVLDLAMTQRGSPLHDISRLYLQLDVLRAKPQFRPATVARLQHALLTGFDATLTSDRPLFRYLSMLHRINHLSTLSLNRERFPARLMSRRVRRLHQQWIDHELGREDAKARHGDTEARSRSISHGDTEARSRSTSHGDTARTEKIGREDTKTRRRSGDTGGERESE